MTCPDDQLSILSSTQLKVSCKVESANRTQLPIGRIAPLARDSPPFSLSLLTDVEQSKPLQVSQPTSRNCWLPQQLQATTAVHRRQTINGLEASQLRSQPEHPPHSCSGEPAVRPGEGLERLREPGRPGGHTSRVSQSWRQPGTGGGRCPPLTKKKLLLPSFRFALRRHRRVTGWGNKMFQLQMGGGKI